MRLRLWFRCGGNERRGAGGLGDGKRAVNKLCCGSEFGLGMGGFVGGEGLRGGGLNDL